MKPRRGQAVNVWLHDDDLAQLNELRRALAQNNQFASKSQVLRTCLHLAHPNETFARAFKAIEEHDARRK